MAASVHKQPRIGGLCEELGVRARACVVLGNARRSGGRGGSPSCPARPAASEIRPCQSDPTSFGWEGSHLQASNGHRCFDQDGGSAS
jgi:hypothetical protein